MGEHLHHLIYVRNKGSFLSFTGARKNVTFTNRVHKNDTVLEEVMEFKDLGVLANNSLSWNSHIDKLKVSPKANKMLGLIKRTCNDHKDTTILKTLYCFLVRSNLEYCSVVSSPFTQRNIDKLERIQCKATKFILKSNEPYDVRLSKLSLKLLTLEQSYKIHMQLGKLDEIDHVCYLFQTSANSLQDLSSILENYLSMEHNILSMLVSLN